jgi:hypothetical protein
MFLAHIIIVLQQFLDMAKTNGSVTDNIVKLRRELSIIRRAHEERGNKQVMPQNMSDIQTSLAVRYIHS